MRRRVRQASDWLDITEVRAHCRVLGSEHDATLTSLMAWSLAQAEMLTNRSLADATVGERWAPLQQNEVVPQEVQLYYTEYPLNPAMTYTPTTGLPTVTKFPTAVRYDPLTRCATLVFDSATATLAGSFVLFDWQEDGTPDYETTLVRAARLQMIAWAFENPEGQKDSPVARANAGSMDAAERVLSSIARPSL